MTFHSHPVYKKSFHVEGKTFENAGYVAREVKTLLQAMKFPPDIIRRAAIVTYEAEINICSYADRGDIIIEVSPHEIIIESIDEGQGIEDIELAMREGYSTATETIVKMGFGAGMGLSNIKNFSDSFSITSQVGKGTYLKMIIHVKDAE
ncbi:MAG: hypothetical protein KBE27_02470 [Syntrophorhabdaceae bacterium]|nr:hypothetical protein [Syntrophorhabdales bacterium]MBP9560670.1 hypothetical protein [Syntrophorhabdaceae bacterium]